MGVVLDWKLGSGWRGDVMGAEMGVVMGAIFGAGGKTYNMCVCMHSSNGIHITHRKNQLLLLDMSHNHWKHMLQIRCFF